MNHHISPEASLKQKIKAAFPNAFIGRHMTHSECVQLRPQLIAISADGFEQALAQVLLDLLETHTGKAGQSENAEAVVRFLDVDEDLAYHEGSSGYDSLRERAKDDLLRNAKVESLVDINPQQAEVLAGWLHTAKSWPDLSWYRDEIESALAYWTRRIDV